MKTSLIATALLCAASFGFGQGTPAERAESLSPSAAASPAKVTPYEGLLLTTKVVGSRIKNLQNQDIGTIDDLIFNPDTGRVRFAVLGVGGFLGAGETKVVVPWGAVGLVKGAPGEAPSYVIDAPKDKLSSAPRFDPNKLTGLYARAAAQPIFDYFGIAFFEDVPAPGQSTAPTGKAVTGTPTPGPAASATPSPMGAGLGTSMGNPVASPTASPMPDLASPTASPMASPAH
jgi:sporulation protein YlmC with PRC-barrel domain